MNSTRHSYAFLVAALVAALLSAAARGQSAPEAQSTPSHTFSPAQRAEIEARDQLARTIAANVEADAQMKGDEQWRVRLLSSLYRESSANLRNIAAQARTIDQAQAMAREASRSNKSLGVAGSKALGSVSADLVFTPMTPCRFVDTRKVGGVIPKGATTSTPFNTADYGSVYGGDSNCTVPGNGEIAIAANITVVVASGAAGFLGIRPYGSTSGSSLVNWPIGGTTGVANAAIITTALNQNNDYEFEAFAGGNTPNLIVDYFGYFAPAAPTALSCQTGNESTVTIPPGGENVSGGTCPSGYTSLSIACEAVPPTVFNGTDP